MELDEKVALITGIGEDEGAYLVEWLLSKGYMVHGFKNKDVFKTTLQKESFFDCFKNARFRLHFGDFSNLSNLIDMIQETQPDEIYNLAALSHVKESGDVPGNMYGLEGICTLRIIELVQILGLTNKTKIYQSSTFELYGSITG